MSNWKNANSTKKINFLNFVVERNDIQIKRSRINAIVDWFEFENAKNIIIFLNFVEFYKRFVKKISQIVTSFTNLTRNAKKKIVFHKFFL